VASIRARDVEGATEYLTHTSGGRVDASLIRTFAQNLADNEQHLNQLATVNDAKQYQSC